MEQLDYSPPFPVLPSFGYALFPVRALESRPWIEKERFSGGVNLSARARNVQRINESRKLFVDHKTRSIYGAPSLIYALQEQIARRA